jgi:subtilisin-like proprotein convertase family protein
LIVAEKNATKNISNLGLTDWTFNTVRCWGENPVGEWTIQITDKGKNHIITNTKIFLFPRSLEKSTKSANRK